MVKKLVTLLFASVLVFSLSTPLLAQKTPAKAEKEGAKKQDRWEGSVTMFSKDKSTLIVRKMGTSMSKTVAFDGTTEWVSQEHASKKVNNIDASQVKEGDRVICLGTYSKDGVFHATMISKRLTKQALP